MKSSQLLINKIKEFEGCVLTSYKDSVGIPTIGIGHTNGVKMGQSITSNQAEDLLRYDLLPVEKFINTIKEIDTQGKFDALVDFAFNLGIGALKSSTLLKKVKSNSPNKDIIAEFLRWNKAGGKVMKGLVKRRTWETNRWIQK